MASPPDPIPLLRPRYGPSLLLRTGPSQCPASVRSPRGLLRLCFSLGIGATGSCSSTITPASASRPLNAGRRPPGHQATGGLIPGRRHTPGFDDAVHVTTLHRWVHFRSSLGCIPIRSIPRTWLQRSRPRLLSEAAWSGLGPAPESRSRGANPHRHRSLSAQNFRSCRSSFLCASAAHYRLRAGTMVGPAGLLKVRILNGLARSGKAHRSSESRSVAGPLYHRPVVFGSGQTSGTVVRSHMWAAPRRAASVRQAMSCHKQLEPVGATKPTEGNGM